MVKGASWFVGDLLCHDQYILKSLRKRNEQVIAVEDILKQNVKAAVQNLINWKALVQCTMIQSTK